MGNGLKIHTQMGPSAAAQQASPQQQTQKKGCGRLRFKRAETGAAARLRKGTGLLADKLLRSTAIACALLLGVMTLRNADLPWAQKAVEGVEKVMTMKIDLDDSLGKLHFVRELVPETALVFWNAGSSRALEPPVQGQIEHAWSENQPWRIYACADSAPVSAAFDGEVSQVEMGAMADHIVLITHDNGLETVYAYLSEVYPGPGERIYAGDVIGVTAPGGASRLYFSLMQDGTEADPALWEE